MIFGKDTGQWQALSGNATATEIYNQPGLWQETAAVIAARKDEITAFLERALTPQTRIILTGAGTSDYVGDTIVQTLDRQLPCRVEAIATTDIVAAPYEYIEEQTPTILVSYARSGNSPESLGAYDLFQKGVSSLQQLVITCDGEGDLAQKAFASDNALVLLMPEACNDKGFAMTSSFSCMMLATLLLFDLADFEGNRAVVDTIARQAQTFMDERFKEVQQMVDYGCSRVVYLGSGFYGAFCQEMALKNLELTSGKVLTFNESVMGFRHGPKSIINDETLVVIFVSGNAYTRLYDMDLLDEIHGDAGSHKLVAVTYDGPADLADHCDQVIDFAGDAVPEIYKVFNYMLIGQIFGLLDSVACGITPDNPRPDGTVNRVVQGVTLHPYFE